MRQVSQFETDLLFVKFYGHYVENIFIFFFIFIFYF